MINWVLRILVAAGLLGSAWVHYDLWQNEGFSEIDVIGPLFLLNVIAGVVIAVGVLAWHHWFPPLLAVGFGAATLGAFLLSLRPGGFFGVQEQFDPSSPAWLPELWGVITEAGCVVIGALLVIAELRSRSRSGARQTVSA